MIVERKSLHDFAISVLDGRLFSQAARLAGSTIPSVLILEGTGADLRASGISRVALQGALVSISLVFRIPVLRSAAPEETAHLMLYCANQMRAAAKGALPLHRHRPKGKRRTQLAILQGLPGVGPKRANALLEKYRTVEAVIQATSESIQEIPGIGRETAEAIRWAVTEAAAKFGE
ncbi:MAG: nuclease [Acidobacteria bacterium]|nr:nuclease [Acidobacteriota bacterium]